MARTGSNIYKRKDGRYEGRILSGRNIYQKPQYIYVYAKTLREVKQKMKEIRERKKKEEGAGKLYVKDCAGEWLSKNRDGWKPTTYDTYWRLVHRYIIPILGEYKISAVSQDILEEFIGEIERRSQQKIISGSYRKYICRIVCQIMAFAEEQHQIEVRLPKIPPVRIQKNEMELPDENELKSLETYLLRHLENDTCLGILLAMYTGIRIGELCALQWKDIDLSNGTVIIRHNLQRVQIYGEEGEKKGKTRVCVQMPKTSKSIRVIPIADGLLAVLGEHKKEEEEYLVSGKRKEWTEVRTMQYRFRAILLECAGIPFHFHLLRHVFASRCIRQGCDIKSLSEILGHSSVQVTMNIYVHTSLQQKKDMMNLVCGIR